MCGTTRGSGDWPRDGEPTCHARVHGTSTTRATPSPATSEPALPVQQVGSNPAVGAKAVTLSWDAPSENTDGSPLLNLQGYRVHYGSSSQAYAETIEVSNPGLTTYVVQNLPAGNYHFAVSAYNSSGEESALSGEVSAEVD